MSAKIKAEAYHADLSRDCPTPFLAIGIGHNTPVSLGRVKGKVIGFDGDYTAIVEFPVGTMKIEMEAFL